MGTSNPKREEDLRFCKFGTVSFTKITKVNTFIDYLENGKVMATRCKGCDEIFFPPRADCCHCLSSDMQWDEITGNGTLISYSQLKFAPIGFDADLPYTIALLDYGEFNVFGRIAADVPASELKIGMPMKVISNVLSNGQLNYVFQKAG
ncbi:MAG: Zn-ribbon domain-containing OB-fold protein [Desulfobacterium sp.]